MTFSRLSNLCYRKPFLPTFGNSFEKPNRILQVWHRCRKSQSRSAEEVSLRHHCISTTSLVARKVSQKTRIILFTKTIMTRVLKRRSFLWTQWCSKVIVRCGVFSKTVIYGAFKKKQRCVYATEDNELEQAWFCDCYTFQLCGSNLNEGCDWCPVA